MGGRRRRRTARAPPWVRPHATAGRGRRTERGPRRLPAQRPRDDRLREVRLTLAAASLATGNPEGQELLVGEAIRRALRSQDAYAALEVTSSPLARSLASASDAEALADAVSRARLGQRAIAPHLADNLAESLDIAGSALAQALASREPPRRSR